MESRDSETLINEESADSSSNIVSDKLEKPESSSSSDIKFSEGDKVEARYRGREKWYPGKIDRDHCDGTYDILYDDGEKETKVQADLIRIKPESSSSSDIKFSEGDKVEARYRGSEKCYPGKIDRDHCDGTYDIMYDDGDKEIRVHAYLIRIVSDFPSKFKVGENVIARLFINLLFYHY